MVQPCPARIGDSLDQVETPALVVDLSAYEHNLDHMAEQVGATGLALRPHSKTHKSPLIALQQIERGAVGICCQKVGEAEVMVQGGVRDVLVSNEVVGASKLARLAALARLARISVCVDDAGNLDDLSAAAQAYGSTLEVLVEVEVGGGRCGVEPSETVALARRVVEAPGLGFGGLQAYHGRAQHIYRFKERGAAVRAAMEKTLTAVRALEAAGIACPKVTGGGTGTLPHDIMAGAWSELQAGSYIFMDADYGRVGFGDDDGPPPFQHSLFVLTTVMSRTKQGLAVVDAGLKALAFDSGPPLVWQRPGVTFDVPSDEHGELALAPGSDVALGERVMLVPGHCDPTVNLYDWFVGLRDGRVERLWPVAARGALA